MAVKPKGAGTNMQLNDQDGSGKDAYGVGEYELVSRLLFLFRCSESYFTAITSIDDPLGMALIGLGANDPLQLLQWEYDNFSGLKSLAIPRRNKAIQKSEVFLDTSFKLVNANASKLLDTQSLEKLQISGDAMRLLTGLVPAATLVRRQKELLREELTLKGKGEKTGKQHFISWFAEVEKNGTEVLYREYRVNADMINFPGGFRAHGDFSERKSMIIVFIRKRMLEVPHFKVYYEFLMVQLDEDRQNLFAAMFASPYNMICRFEQDNFASNFEWTKPKPLKEFKSLEGKLRVITCKISDLAPIHDDSTRGAEEMRVINMRVDTIRKFFDDMEESVEACVMIIDIVARYSRDKKDYKLLGSCEKVVDGFYYGLHVMQYREKVMEKFGHVSEHYLMLILRCLDPDIKLSAKEIQFVKMWHFLWVNDKMPDIAYATNFFEVARLESMSELNSRRTRVIYRKICECLPKIGKFVKERTEALQEPARVRILANYFPGV